MYFVWFDGDRRRGPHLKLTDAINAYIDKFGKHPAICLASHHDASEIASRSRRPPITVHGADFVSRNTYYLGADEEVNSVEALHTCAA